MTDWALAVDFGTTFTTAAMISGDTATLLELDGSTKIPSAVALDDDGTLVVGLASGDETGWAPDRVERNPKRSLGRTRHLVLDGRPIVVGEAVGALLRALADEGTRRRNGVAPSRLVLTHPVRWSAARCAELAAAATAVGLPDPLLVPEPVAAARHYLDERITAGDLVAVYDLGGGTFDTAVLRRTEDGFELAGEPGGNADLGGERLDDLLFGMVTARLSSSHPELTTEMLDGATPAGRRQAAELRRDLRRAKEALSRQQSFTVHVSGADVDLRLTRPEFEALVAAPLRDTVDELAATVERCGVEPGAIAAIYLVGGASRTPLVSRLVSERFGDLPATFDDPKAVVVLGAAGMLRSGAAAQRTTEDAPEAPRPVYADVLPPVPSAVTPPVVPAAGTATRRRGGRWLVPVAASVLAAALLGGGAVAIVPRLASATTPAPAAVVEAPLPAVVPAAPVSAPAAAPAPSPAPASSPVTTARRAPATAEKAEPEKRPEKKDPTTTTHEKTTETTAPSTTDCSMTGSCDDSTTGGTSGTTGGTDYGLTGGTSGGTSGATGSSSDTSGSGY